MCCNAGAARNVCRCQQTEPVLAFFDVGQISVHLAGQFAYGYTVVPLWRGAAGVGAAVALDMPTPEYPSILATLKKELINAGQKFTFGILHTMGQIKEKTIEQLRAEIAALQNAFQLRDRADKQETAELQMQNEQLRKEVRLLKEEAKALQSQQATQELLKTCNAVILVAVGFGVIGVCLRGGLNWRSRRFKTRFRQIWRANEDLVRSKTSLNRELIESKKTIGHKDNALREKDNKLIEYRDAAAACENNLKESEKEVNKLKLSGVAYTSRLKEKEDEIHKYKDKLLTKESKLMESEEELNKRNLAVASYRSKLTEKEDELNKYKHKVLTQENNLKVATRAGSRKRRTSCANTKAFTVLLSIFNSVVS